MTNHVGKTLECCTDQVVRALKALIRETPEYALESVTTSVIERNLEPSRLMAGLNGHVMDEVDDKYVCGLVRMEFTVRQDEAPKLLGRDGDHVPWLDSKAAELFGPHGFWDNYRRLLEGRLAPHPRNRLDEITSEILDSLEDPTRAGQWDRRGLVMGHVQSGKTNNYIGLICKAADAGYKLIIVLAGTHNNLRAQTQFRVDEGFTGRDTREGATSVEKVGVGREKKHGAVMSLTSATDQGDFKVGTAAAVGFDFGSIDHPTVFVVKKNVHVLRNLHQWIQANAHKPEGYERVAGIPLLLIDDEADHASINTADMRDPEADPAATNRAIRLILNSFDQTAYVGYTATPFANIFIDDEAESPEYGEDLFPRSFIFSLQAPSDYVGPERVFGLTSSADLPEKPSIPLVNDVTDTALWVPDKHRADQFVDEERFPRSLERAICSFVLSNAARRLRHQSSEHKSMLIHVTPYVAPQKQVRDQVSDYLINVKNDLMYNGSDSGSMWQFLEEIWTQDFVPANQSLTQEMGSDAPPLHDFQEIRSEIVAAIGKIQIRMINGQSQDALDYRLHADGLSSIVIGGAKLSRGLTLEGLSVSYYLRSTRMYDTLMQMGRWFGYRPGYLDLCRIYTTPDISDSYQNIAVATRELLDEFAQMQNEGATPADFGLKVRHSPGMLVTSQTKMRNGTLRRVAFGDTRPEVTTFSSHDAIRQTCLDLLESFVATLRDRGTTEGSQSDDYAWRGVPAQVVIEYFDALERSNLYGQARSAVPKYLAEYIQARVKSKDLVSWTVLLKSNSQALQTYGQEGIHEIAGLKVGLASRAPRGSRSLGTYSINSLIGSQDEAFDLTEDQLLEARHLAKGGKAYGTAYRRVRPATQGLLILYLLRGQGFSKEDRIPDGPPFAAYCVSFPTDPTGTTIEYVVNNKYDDLGSA